MSEFNMNSLLRSYVRDDEPQTGAERATQDDESIGGKADGGAGQERVDTGATDMNSWLREAVLDSRGRSA